MSDLYTDDEEEQKIPYDGEPIQRKIERGDDGLDLLEVKRTTKKTNKLVSTLLVVIVALAFAVGAISVGLSLKINKLSNNRADYTMNITSTGYGSAVAKGMLSVVCVSASNTNNGGNITNFFSSAMTSRGSGVILEVNKDTGDAYIITNYHVVANSSSLIVYDYRWVLLWDSLEPIYASYVGGSKSYDLAVLKITGSDTIKNSSCASASVADSVKVKLGQEVYTIGNSMARNLRVGKGVVSVEEDVMSESLYISHTADVNSGNSGGGLFDANGDLIGVVNAKFKDVNDAGNLIYKEMIQGMNYAIPSSMALCIARNIIRNSGNLMRPSIGLVFGKNYSYTENGKTYLVGEDGLGYTTYKMAMLTNSGSFKTGDELVSLTYTYGGVEKTVEINRLTSIESNMFYFEDGQTVQFVVKRAGIEKTINVTISSFDTVK